MKLRISVPWLIAGLLLVGAAVWTATKLEWVEEKTRTGMRGEARQDPHYAARLLIGRLGYRTEVLKDSTRLADLPTGSTLFMSAILSQSLARHMEPRVRDWVTRGGHLVVIVPGPEQSDRFLTSLGIKRLGRHHADGAETVSIQGHPLKLQFPDCDVFAVNQPLLWSGEVIAYRRYARQRHDDAERNEDDEEEDEDGDENAAKSAKPTPPTLVNAPALAVARWNLGRGRVSALCDNRPLINGLIGQHDHAVLAARLLLDTRPGTVYFATEPDAPSLTAWLVDHAPGALIACGLLIAFGLWHAIPRHGPPRPDPLPHRPGLRTHLDAVAAFHMRHREWDSLLAPLRDEVRRLAQTAARHGAAKDLASLAREHAIDPGALQQAMEARPQRRADFDACARTLDQFIRRLAARRATLTSFVRNDRQP